jgi:HEPN domain-containing protein
MITRADLIRIAKARLKDARVLEAGGRFDGSLYLCGYAVELALKARICRTLKWPGFPSSRSDFDGLQSFKVHDLDLLLKLSGVEGAMKARHLADWSVVTQWNPEARYKLIGTAKPSNAQDMIRAAASLLRVLCRH